MGSFATYQYLANRYVYDIVFPEDSEGGPSLVNRSVFAMADSGAPDGIKLDTRGNVYAGWWVSRAIDVGAGWLIFVLSFQLRWSTRVESAWHSPR